MKKARLRLVLDFEIEPPDLNASKNESKAPEDFDLEVRQNTSLNMMENRIIASVITTTAQLRAIPPSDQTIRKCSTAALRSGKFRGPEVIII